MNIHKNVLLLLAVLVSPLASYADTIVATEEGIEIGYLTFEADHTDLQLEDLENGDSSDRFLHSFFQGILDKNFDQVLKTVETEEGVEITDGEAYLSHVRGMIENAPVFCTARIDLEHSTAYVIEIGEHGFRSTIAIPKDPEERKILLISKDHFLICAAHNINEPKISLPEGDYLELNHPGSKGVNLLLPRISSAPDLPSLIAAMTDEALVENTEDLADDPASIKWFRSLRKPPVSAFGIHPHSGIVVYPPNPDGSSYPISIDFWKIQEGKLRLKPATASSSFLPQCLLESGDKFHNK